MLVLAMALVTAREVVAWQDPDVDESATILARERALATAVTAKDKARLDELLASRFVLSGSPDIARATWIDNAAGLCWGKRFSIDRFSAQSLGGAVVATFELTFYSDPVRCRPAIVRSVITDLWTRDGVWRLALRHAAPSSADGPETVPQFGRLPLPPPAWDVSGELSLVATGGNTSTRTIGVGANVVHQTRSQSTRVAVAYLTTESEAITRARSLTVDTRQGVRVGERIELFTAGGYASDRFPNWRGSSVSTIIVGLTRLLSLKATHAIEHRNRQVAGCTRTDWRSAAALVVSFQSLPALR